MKQKQILDDYVVVERELESSELIKRIYNKGDRPPARPHMNAAQRKQKREKQKLARAKRERAERERRVSLGICSRCGKLPARDGYRMCESCSLKSRKYLADSYDDKLTRGRYCG